MPQTIPHGLEGKARDFQTHWLIEGGKIFCPLQLPIEHSLAPCPEAQHLRLLTGIGFEGNQKMGVNHPFHSTEPLHPPKLVVPQKEALYGPGPKRSFLLPPAGLSQPTHICNWMDWPTGYIYQPTNSCCWGSKTHWHLFYEVLSADLLEFRQKYSQKLCSNV